MIFKYCLRMPESFPFFFFFTFKCWLLSCVQLFMTPWAVAHQTPLSMGFIRQEYWRGLPCLPPQSSWPRGRSWISCIEAGFFTDWATREAQKFSLYQGKWFDCILKHYYLFQTKRFCMFRLIVTSNYLVYLYNRINKLSSL